MKLGSSVDYNHAGQPVTVTPAGLRGGRTVTTTPSTVWAARWHTHSSPCMAEMSTLMMTRTGQGRPGSVLFLKCVMADLFPPNNSCRVRQFVTGPEPGLRSEHAARHEPPDDGLARARPQPRPLPLGRAQRADGALLQGLRGEHLPAQGRHRGHPGGHLYSI